MGIQELGQALLFRVKKGDDCVALIDQIANLEMEELRVSLTTDAEKNTFWINLYNAFNQYHMKKLPPGEQIRVRIGFFGKRQIKVAGARLSLNDIEHGLLRRSKVWWGLGYLPKIWVSAFERDFRVQNPDSRIHFTLNCGAKSCPPIRFYEVDRIEEQLEMATRGYLTMHTHFKKEPPTLHLSSLFLMYRGDFGGRKKILEFVRGYIHLPNGPMKVNFTSWDRSGKLDYFVD